MAPKAAAPKAKAAAEEAKKRKAEEDAAPPAKEAKLVEPKAKAKAEPAPESTEPKVEEHVEKEKDAPADKRTVLKDPVGFYTSETTMNVVPTMGGKVLMALTEGGIQYLVAGARANVGIKGGRYAFEVKIVEALNPAESSVARTRMSVPRQLVRVGLSVAGSPLVLNEREDQVYFDSEGFFCVGKTKTAVAQRFSRDQVIAVVVNLEPKSPNANTISLFRDGERIAEPQPIPDNLKGKVLFPHICYRSLSIHVNFGPSTSKALPFKCRMLSTAAQADTQLAPSPEPKDGKYEILLPVSLPDEGSFDWLDTFLAKNPQYLEISDRSILEWAASSGLTKPKNVRGSNDKPDFSFGLPGMDEVSIRKVLASMMFIMPRHLCLMEVKANLVPAEREEVLKKFSAPHFKKTAVVAVGEPPKEFKEAQRQKMLAEKQEKLDIEYKNKKAAEEAKKQMELRQKQLQEIRKKQEEQKKKAEEEAKKAAEAAKGEGEGDAEMKVEEVKEEEKEEEKKEDVEMKEEEETKEEEPPVATLTEEEEARWFKTPGAVSDLTVLALSNSFASFAIPEKAEGFDNIQFVWQKEKQAKDYLKKWVSERKVTMRMEDLQPSAWFKEKYAEFGKILQEWQTKQKTAKETKKEEPKAIADGEAAAEAPAAAADTDPQSVEDILDVGNGLPLFAKFSPEDWALVQLRYELYLLYRAYKNDVNDDERIGIHESNLAFYFAKYYKKQLSPKAYGLDTIAELLEMVKDTVTLDSDTQVLQSALSEETETADIFVKVTEEVRRERQRRIDAGDETAKLKFTQLVLQPTVAGAAPVVAANAGKWAGGGKAAGKGLPVTPGFRPPWGAKGSFGKGYGKGWGK